MSSHLARDGRRRRVLNEEVRAASGLATVGFSAEQADDADAPRYGEQASIEHHPQITDFVPRRGRAVMLTLLAGLGVAAATETLAHYAAQAAAATPGIDSEQISGQLARGIAAWASSLMLLFGAAAARIIYALRRHRIDDSRGRYRVWRLASWLAVAASLNAVVGAHTLVARAAAAMTGWSLTAGGAEWWILPAAVPAVWIGARLAQELVESRAALIAGLLAAASFAVAAAGALGWAPAALGTWSSALTGGAPVVGCAFTLVAFMLFARYVVLDVQGLIEHAPRAAKPRRDAKPAAPTDAAKAAEPRPAATPALIKRVDVAESTDDAAEDEDDQPTFLSKSERKRLRKQQQQRQNRAA